MLLPPKRIGYAIDALDRFWADLPVASVEEATCRRYTKMRGVSDGTIRHELNTLQSAINYCHREGPLTNARKMTMAPKTAAHKRWLTRS